MADTIRQQIVTAIDTRLKTIKTTAGYNFNLGNNVYQWRTTTLPESETPAIIFQDTSNTRDDTGVIGKFRWMLNVEIDIAAAASASDMRNMIMDVYKAIGADYTWGGLALYTTQPDSDEMQFEQNEKTIGGTRIKLSIIYDAPKWQM